MSCGACQPQNQSQTRGCVSDTEESNVCDSAYTSDIPSGDDCGCDRDNDDCGDCGGGERSCSKNGGEQRTSQQYRTDSKSGRGSNGGQNKKSCGCGAGSGSRQSHQSSSQQNRLSSTMRSGSGQQSGSRTSGGRRMSQNENQQRDSRASSRGFVNGGCPDEVRPQEPSCNQPTYCERFRQGSQSGSQGMENAEPQDAQRYSGSKQYSDTRQNSGEARGSAPNAQMPEGGSVSQTRSLEGAQPKQIIAPCCFPDKSQQSLTDKNSQRKISYGQKSGCPCGPESMKPTADVNQEFVCPSCAEFENMEASDYCEAEDVPDEPVEEQPKEEDQGNFSSECQQDYGYESESVPQPPESDEKQKKKNGHGFWQQFQFQIFQQQDGDEDENAASQYNGQNGSNNCEQCIAENARNDQDHKKSGNKIWQQLTLDIFQSKDDDGSDADNEGSRQGWQQQVKLQIFQEKSNGDGEEEEPIDNNEADECEPEDPCVC